MKWDNVSRSREVCFLVVKFERSWKCGCGRTRVQKWWLNGKIGPGGWVSCCWQWLCAACPDCSSSIPSGSWSQTGWVPADCVIYSGCSGCWTGTRKIDDGAGRSARERDNYSVVDCATPAQQHPISSGKGPFRNYVTLRGGGVGLSVTQCDTGEGRWSQCCYVTHRVRSWPNRNC